MWIELVMHMSGTRANGERYPPGWTAFQVADWEGEHLVRGGMAREVAAPPPPSPPPPLPVPPYAPAQAPPAPSNLTEPDLIEPAQGGQELQGDPPAPADSKLAWVSYAISQGADPDTASRMTKADLQSRYGGRL